MPSKRGKDKSIATQKTTSSAVNKGEKNNNNYNNNHNNVKKTSKTKAQKETKSSATAATIRSNGDGDDEVIEATSIDDNSDFLERDDAKNCKVATSNANLLQDEATVTAQTTTAAAQPTDKIDIGNNATTEAAAAATTTPLNEFTKKATNDGDDDKKQSDTTTIGQSEDNKAELSGSHTNIDGSNTLASGDYTKGKKPPNLNEITAEILPDTAQLPYCPITPRCVVDTNEHEDDPFGTEPNKSEKMQKQQLADAVADNDDDDYDDGDDYADPPEEELLVQFLGEANRIAEARLAARRQARAEAREIRMRELERQQKEQEQNADRVFDMHSVGASSSDTLARTRLVCGLPVGGLINATRVVSASSMSSRRSSEDSLEEEGRSLRDIRYELKDVEERFRKAMIANAQLDNDRASQTFEMKLLKDKIETMQESYAQLEREFKEKSRDYNALKRNLDRLTLELKLVQGQLNERDTLIAEQGLVIVAVENADGTDAKRALVSVENANVLASVQGSLDVRLKKFNEEKQQLVGEVQKLQEQLEIYKSEGKGRGNSMNGPLGSDEDYEAQREANKIISDYKYKLQKAEQEIASLQASLARSETQVIRYKSTAEAAEKAEAELKVERRKLQRENREAMERLEELETSNNHLLKRLDKLKNAKSALLKDL